MLHGLLADVIAFAEQRRARLRVLVHTVETLVGDGRQRVDAVGDAFLLLRCPGEVTVADGSTDIGRPLFGRNRASAEQKPDNYRHPSESHRENCPAH